MCTLKLDHLMKRMLRKKITIVMYHGIVDDDYDFECWWLINKSKFIRQINYLNNNFNIISIDDALDEKNLSDNSCILTFDDGYKSVLTLAYPVLSKMNIPFTVYITTGPVEKRTLLWVDQVFAYLHEHHIDNNIMLLMGMANYSYLYQTNKTKLITKVINRLKQIEYEKKNELIKLLIDGNQFKNFMLKPETRSFEMLTVDDIRKLADDPMVTMGAHTVNHEILTRMPLHDAVKEISESRYTLEKWIGRNVYHFAYPDGNYNTQLAESVKQIGFKSACRIGLMVNWIVKKYELCRVGTGSWDDDYEFRAMVNGIIPLKVEARNFIRKIFAVS